MWRRAVQSSRQWSGTSVRRPSSCLSLKRKLEWQYPAAAVTRSSSLSTLQIIESSGVESLSLDSPRLYIENPRVGRVVAQNLVHALHVVAADSTIAYSSLDEETSVHTHQDPWVRSDGAHSEASVEQHEIQEAVQEESLPPRLLNVKSPADSKTVAERPVVAAPEGSAVDTLQLSRRAMELQGQLIMALRTGRPGIAMQLFRQSVQKDMPIDPSILRDLFFIFVHINPIEAYDVLDRYRTLSHEPVSVELYSTMCEALGKTNMKHNSLKHFHRIVTRLKRDLYPLDKETYHQVCYPKLLLSLVQQPIQYFGDEASKLYRYMNKQNYQLTPDIIEQLLKASRFSRQRDLPFPRLLSQLVEQGYRPDPKIAVPVLQNLFPFVSLIATTKALKAIVDLQKESLRVGDGVEYRVDIGTLEQVSAIAARTGTFELNLLVWDLMDMLRYAPNEAIYENTIQAFSMTYRQDHSALSVLGEMESHGFEPSRALINSISRSLRYSVGRIDNAYHLLTDGTTDGARVTVASLNVIVSACAGIGDVDRAFATLDDFPRFELEPNVDTYSYVLEALTRNIDPYFQKDDTKRLADAPLCLDAAESILVIMEERGLQICHHCIEQYVLLLCFAGRMNEASTFLLRQIEKGVRASNKTILILASEFARMGEFETARMLASKTTEPITFLESRIDRWERQDKELQEAHDEIENAEREN